MDYVARAHGVRRFILMGNCALANVCFNTALSDTRVVGLILSNPYVSQEREARLSQRIRRHLFSIRSWQRLLRGEFHLRRRPDPEEIRLKNYAGDVALPADFARRLQGLVLQRGMRILIACSRAEPGLVHLHKFHRRAWRELATSGGFCFDILPTDCHDFSATEEAAAKLNDLISDWVKSSWTSAEVAPSSRVRARRPRRDNGEARPGPSSNRRGRPLRRPRPVATG